MRVEPTALADLDRVVSLWVALADEQRAHGSHLTAEPNRDLMREALAQQVVDHTCLVARAEDDEGATSGAIVGFVSFGLERDGLDRDLVRGVVHNLYVVPAARRRGIGSELLSVAETALVVAGADRVALEALAANAEARRFYEARGYEAHRVGYERVSDDEERGVGDGKDTKGEG